MKKKKPFLSIIIPVLNNKIGFEKTLKSIFNQKFEDYEVIVIDGKSDDGTLKIIKKFRKKIHKIISEKDRGIYDAINKGINLSSGKYINTINADDVYYSTNSLNIAKKYLIKNNYDFLFGAVLKNKIYYKYEPKCFGVLIFIQHIQEAFLLKKKFTIKLDYIVSNIHAHLIMIFFGK